MRQDNQKYSLQDSREGGLLQKLKIWRQRIPAMILLLLLLATPLWLSACSGSSSLAPADAGKEETTTNQSASEKEAAKTIEEKQKEEAKETTKASEEEQAKETNKETKKAVENTETKSPAATKATEVTPYQVVVVDGEDVRYEPVETDDFMLWLKEQEKPVFLDFWASWCPPCLMSSPYVDELAAAYPEKITVVKANVDLMDKDVAKNFNVMSIPAFYLLDKGEEVEAWVGFAPGFEEIWAEKIEAMFK